MKINLKKVILFMAIVIIDFIGMDKVSAATGGISVKASSNNAIIGNTIRVTATVYSSSPLGSWDATLSYDSSKLSLLSSDVGQRMVGYGDGSKTSSSYAFTFRAKSSGTATISISSANILDWTTEQAISIVRGSTSISIISQEQLESSYSKNNNLAALSVDGAELSPSFNKDILEYSVEFKPETLSTTINASIEDSTATINGAGAINLSEGENVIEVKVTAQNGNLKTYKIKATVKEYNPIIVKVDGKDYTVVRKKSSLIAPNNYKESTVKINNEDVPAFTSEITKYTLVALKNEKGIQNFYIYEKGSYKLYKEFKFNNIVLYPMELKKVPSGYFKTTIKYNEDKINAYKIDKDSDYSLIYGMNVENGKINTYTYDSKENTVQIYDDEYIKKISKETELYLKILIGLSVGLVISIGTIIFILIKNNKKIKPEKIKHEKIKDRFFVK